MGEWTVGRNNDDDDKPKRKAAKPVARRSVLKTSGLAAAGVLGLAAAAIGGRAYQTGALNAFDEGLGFEPLRAWKAQLAAFKAAKGGKTGSPLTGNAKGLIAAGLLAASPHNSQPWKFIIRDKTIDVLADDARNLGAIDPRRREMMIGLGCCIENMVLGASAVGITPLLNVFPDGPDGTTIARITIYDGTGQASKEAEALARRQTDRGPYVVARQIDSKILTALDALVSSASTKLIWLRAETDAGKRFAAATIKATADFIADAELVAASDKWMRLGPGSHSDGLTLPTVGLPPLMTRMALMVPKGLSGDPNQTWLEMTRDVHVATAPQFGLITVPSLDDREGLVEAGRLWQRLHVQATIMGLSVQPLNQLLEMADRDAALTRPSPAATTLAGLATLSDSVFAFAFRMGYSRSITNPSPRRGITEVLAA